MNAPPTATELGFSGRMTAEVAGITYRQLDYWARTGFVTPSLNGGVGSGHRRRYSYNDLVHLRAVKSLLDAGIPLERIRVLFGHMVAQGDDLTSAQVVIAGNVAVITRTGDELIECITRYRHHGVVRLLDLGAIVEQVHAAISEYGWPS